MGVDSIPRTIAWIDGGDVATVRIVDQRLLPGQCILVDLRTADDTIAAIQSLAVRGAPALGVAGAMALCLWAKNECDTLDDHQFFDELDGVARRIATARPTAVNLSWGVRQIQVLARARRAAGDCVLGVVSAMVVRACEMAEEDEAANRAIGVHGANLLKPGTRILTHCNAGSLATVYFGTALGVVYEAHCQGKIEHVYADETRPINQGARLTMWEMTQAGVPCTLQCDSMAAALMAAGKVDAVVVGADRICANGDTANKIGTYQLAISAAYHHIPFYVAAPMATVDFSLAQGSCIPIEHRGAQEVIDIPHFSVDVYNPAFDVTPAALITAIITECGVVFPAQTPAGLSQFNLSKNFG